MFLRLCNALRNFASAPPNGHFDTLDEMSAREFLPLLLALSALAPGAAAQAQTESDMSSLHVVKVAPDQPISALVPFAIESPGAAAKSLEFREPDAMTRNDQDLAADAEATIQEKAGFQNLEFQPGYMDI